MNQDIIQPKRRSGRVARTIRVLLTIAALTGAGLSLGGCYGQFCGYDNNGEVYCW